MQTPDVIRTNRVKMRLSQAELAREIGVDTRQINRYETGETEPSLAVARKIADRLRISMDELAGGLSPLNGTWHSAWHNLIPGSDTVLVGPVELAQQGHHLTVQPVRGPATPITATGDNADADGAPAGLVWSAEMFVDVDTLLGGFKISSAPTRGRGLLNLTHRDNAVDGDWIRLALGGSSTGRVVLARTPEDAATRLDEVLRTL